VKWSAAVLILFLTACAGARPEAALAPTAGLGVGPEISGRVGRIELEVTALQKQVSTQTNLYDLSRNQLADREKQYQRQAHLWKGMIFFLMGLTVVFFFAPSPRTRWAMILMVGTLVLTMALMGVWLFHM
jgi:hypothetical protein